MQELMMEGVGGHKLFTRKWRSHAEPHGVVVIVPGFNSHGGYYLWTAERMAATGLAVYAVDLRGRGRSEGERFYVEKFTDYVSDVHVLVTRAKAENPGLPVILFGHSAGGVISCGYVLDHPDEVQGLVCESFAFQVPAPDFALAILKGISHIAPHLHVLKLDNNGFSRDPAVVAAMNADPLIAGEVQPTLTVAEMVRADERLKREFPLITLPVFILHGTADVVTRPEGSQLFFDTAGSKDKTLKLYEGHVHDLLADVGKEEVLADIQAWIDAHVRR